MIVDVILSRALVVQCRDFLATYPTRVCINIKLVHMSLPLPSNRFDPFPLLQSSFSIRQRNTRCWGCRCCKTPSRIRCRLGNKKVLPSGLTRSVELQIDEPREDRSRHRFLPQGNKFESPVQSWHFQSCESGPRFQVNNARKNVRRSPLKIYDPEWRFGVVAQVLDAPEEHVQSIYASRSNRGF